MVKTTVYLDETVVARLQELSHIRHRSQAELIRDALAGFVDQALLSRPQPVGVGEFRSGRSDIGGRAEELLRKAARARSFAD
jgi:hypothetical protein